ncbi:MAG: amino acid racemase [Gemmatimonadetes bacterium]|nr:amino acid racemase [Gemmatimonadota bacterium]
MKTLGIVGGIAPSSTIEYYRKLVSGHRARATDGSYPQVVINSMNLAPMLAFMHAGRYDDATTLLAGELRKVERAGVDAALFASNTPHLLFDALEASTTVPLISIVTATVEATRALGLRHVGLIGTRFTMQGGYYQAGLARAGITCVVPPPADQELIHARYMQEFVHGVYRPETAALLWELVQRWRRNTGFEALILGGTELPLALPGAGALDLPLLDTTSIHVDAALDLLHG